MIDESQALDAVVELEEQRQALQARRVIDVARGSQPDLAAEGIRIVHDFPERKDTDWQVADGPLEAYPAILTALGAINNRKLEPRTNR